MIGVSILVCHIILHQTISIIIFVTLKHLLKTHLGQIFFVCVRERIEFSLVIHENKDIPGTVTD